MRSRSAGSLPYSFVVLPSDPFQDHLGRRAEQHDRVEPVVEVDLVPHPALDEHRAIVVGAKELGQRSSIHTQSQPPGSPGDGTTPATPARRCHDAEAGLGKRDQRRRFPFPDMPVTSTFVSTNGTGPGAADGRLVLMASPTGHPGIAAWAWRRPSSRVHTHRYAYDTRSSHDRDGVGRRSGGGRRRTRRRSHDVGTTVDAGA